MQFSSTPFFLAFLKPFSILSVVVVFVVAVFFYYIIYLLDKT